MDYADFPRIPPSADADDSDVDKTRKMFAYEAMAVLNSTSSSSGSPTVTIYETTDNGKKNTTLSLANNEIRVLGDDPTVEKQLESFGTAEWILKTNPEAAALSSGGQLKATVDSHAGGTFEGKVFDNDLLDDPVSISVGLSAGSGVSAGVSIGINIETDSDEAAVGMGFAFSSDKLGDDKDDKLEMISGDDPDPLLSVYWDHQQKPFGYNPDPVVVKGPKNHTSKAKGVLEGMASARQEDGGIYPGSNAQAKMASYGSIFFYVSNAGYESPDTMPGPEEGYDE